MSLRFKTLAAVNVAGWLVAVPLLLAALLTPIVGFSGWEDRLLPGGGDGTVRLAPKPAKHVNAPNSVAERAPAGSLTGASHGPKDRK